MNKKGQVLVIFIIILPLLLLLVTLTISSGFILYERKKIDSNIELIIEEQLKKIDSANSEQISKQIKENINASFVNVNVVNNTITVQLTTNLTSPFSEFLKHNKEIKLNYKGYIDNNQIIVEQE